MTSSLSETTGGSLDGVQQSVAEALRGGNEATTNVQQSFTQSFYEFRDTVQAAVASAVGAEPCVCSNHCWESKAIWLSNRF